jgi:hypothetical protein
MWAETWMQAGQENYAGGVCSTASLATAVFCLTGDRFEAF